MFNSRCNFYIGYCIAFFGLRFRLPLSSNFFRVFNAIPEFIHTLYIYIYIYIIIRYETCRFTSDKCRWTVTLPGADMCRQIPLFVQQCQVQNLPKPISGFIHLWTVIWFDKLIKRLTCLLQKPIDKSTRSNYRQWRPHIGLVVKFAIIKVKCIHCFF